MEFDVNLSYLPVYFDDSAEDLGKCDSMDSCDSKITSLTKTVENSKTKLENSRKSLKTLETALKDAKESGKEAAKEKVKSAKTALVANEKEHTLNQSSLNWAKHNKLKADSSKYSDKSYNFDMIAGISSFLALFFTAISLLVYFLF